MRSDPLNLEDIPTLPLYDMEWQKETPYLFNGLPIVIEYLAGDTRTKKSSSGFTVSSEMPAAYGRILFTTDAHGEEIDMYLAPMASVETTVYVLDQVNPGSNQFDEHKVMLGFGSIEEIIHTYCGVFGDGSGAKRIGAITAFTMDEFKAWLSTDGSFLKGASDCGNDKSATVKFAGVTPNGGHNQDKPADRDQTGGVVVELEDLSKGPKIKSLASANGGFEYHLYLLCALSCELWSTTVDTMCRLFDLARDTDSVHIHIASPGGSVWLMGRMVSGMDRTKAKVITYAEGSVASAATAIWAAGHERHILPGAYFMQHMSSQLLGGKTTDIAAKSVFCVDYINAMMQKLVDIGLFTTEEVADMGEKSCDVYISGREAIARVGAVSTRS